MVAPIGRDALAVGAAVPLSLGMANTPKLILVIVADQLRVDHTGFGGAQLAFTPHIDSIASRGTVLDRAYATNPSCGPSRASIATGRWPSVHGSRCNGIPLDPASETAMSALSRSGWTCAAVGKLHLQTMGFPFEQWKLDELAQAGSQAVDGRRDARPLDDRFALDWENIDRHRSERVKFPDSYYGFRSVDLVSGHGDHASGHYVGWLQDKGVDTGPLAGFENSVAPSDLWNEVWQSGVPSEFSTSSYVAERAIAQIHQAAERDEPTFLFVSFPDPHHPFCPPADYSGLVDPADVSLPSTFDQSPAGLPVHIRTMLERRGQPDADWTFTFSVTEAQYREAMVAEAGLIAMLDDSVGQILEAVDNAGLAEETMTVFTADHGDLLGDHGLAQKGFVHYDGVTRVPLVIARDGLEPKRSDALVSNADLVPTILDIAGVEHYRGIQGRSLCPLLDGAANQHRDAVLIEEDQPNGFNGLPVSVRMRTLVTHAGRITLYHGTDQGELYDHRLDPLEKQNLFGTETDLEAELKERMLYEALDLADVGRRVIYDA